MADNLYFPPLPGEDVDGRIVASVQQRDNGRIHVMYTDGSAELRDEQTGQIYFKADAGAIADPSSRDTDVKYDDDDNPGRPVRASGNNNNPSGGGSGGKNSSGRRVIPTKDGGVVVLPEGVSDDDVGALLGAYEGYMTQVSEGLQSAAGFERDKLAQAWREAEGGWRNAVEIQNLRNEAQIYGYDVEREIRMSELLEKQRQFNDQLVENVRQFDVKLGEDARQFNTQIDENARQFNTQLGENVRQFNTKHDEGTRQFNEQMRLTYGQAVGMLDGNPTLEMRQWLASATGYVDGDPTLQRQQIEAQMRQFEQQATGYVGDNPTLERERIEDQRRQFEEQATGYVGDRPTIERERLWEQIQARQSENQIEYKRLELQYGRDYADAWKKEQDVELAWAAHSLSQGELGMQYLQYQAKLANSPSDYFELAEFEAGARERGDVPIFLQNLNANQAASPMQARGLAPTPNSPTSMMGRLGFNDDQEQFPEIIDDTPPDSPAWLGSSPTNMMGGNNMAYNTQQPGAQQQYLPVDPKFAPQSVLDQRLGYRVLPTEPGGDNVPNLTAYLQNGNIPLAERQALEAQITANPSLAQEWERNGMAARENARYNAHAQQQQQTVGVGQHHRPDPYMSRYEMQRSGPDGSYGLDPFERQQRQSPANAGGIGVYEQRQRNLDPRNVAGRSGPNAAVMNPNPNAAAQKQAMMGQPQQQGSYGVMNPNANAAAMRPTMMGQQPPAQYGATNVLPRGQAPADYGRYGRSQSAALTSIYNQYNKGPQKTSMRAWSSMDDDDRDLFKSGLKSLGGNPARWERGIARAAIGNNPANAMRA